MSEKNKAPEKGGQDACSDEPNKRNARRQRLCKHLHAAGPRPVMEALLAVDGGQPLDDVLEDYGRVPSSFFSILGASSFARLFVVRGSST
jgi:hypothetical protein